MTQRRRSESGEGRIGCFIWLLVLGAVVMVAMKWIPARIATAEFRDYMSDQAKFAQHTNAELLKKRLLEKAVSLKLPIEKDDCSVVKEGDRIKMECSYAVDLEFPGYTYTWEFDEQIDEPIFIF